MQAIILLSIALASAILILVVLNAFLFWFFYRMIERIDSMFGTGKVKNLKQVLFSHADQLKEHGAELRNAFEKIKNLENISEKTFQKMGVVRFNPFSEMGGNQSFAVALLDNKNNGFVILSLFLKEGNRVYAKVIREGKSNHSLSAEEKEAIARAIDSK